MEMKKGLNTINNILVNFDRMLLIKDRNKVRQARLKDLLNIKNIRIGKCTDFDISKDAGDCIWQFQFTIKGFTFDYDVFTGTGGSIS